MSLQNPCRLYSRPENDLYKLLIDTYRFRKQDNVTLEGDRGKLSIYAREANGWIGFDVFMRLASTDGLLPSWWSKGQADEELPKEGKEVSIVRIKHTEQVQPVTIYLVLLIVITNPLVGLYFDT